MEDSTREYLKETKKVSVAGTNAANRKGGYAMRQDETYWREGFNFDFETDDGKEISHDFDFIEVCGDNQYFIC